MTHDQIDRLGDHGGVPLGGVVEQALDELLPRLRRVFPIFRNDAFVTGILERASRRIRRRQCAHVIDNLQAYAWVTLRHVALSWLRSGAGKMAQRTVSASNGATMPALTAVEGTAAQIETRVLARELLAHLTPGERLLCRWRAAGFTSREIAAMRGTTAAAVDTSLSRIRCRLRMVLGDVRPTSPTSRRSASIAARTPRRPRGAVSPFERAAAHRGLGCTRVTSRLPAPPSSPSSHRPEQPMRQRRTRSR